MSKHDEKMAALLAEVAKVLEPLKSKDATAAKVAKEVAKMVQEDKIRGFKVMKRFRVKFTPSQLMLLDGKGPKDRKAAAAKVNSSLTKLLNSDVEPTEVRDTMVKVLQSMKEIGAWNKHSEALLDQVIEAYTKERSNA
jgi:hypothetical protein